MKEAKRSRLQVEKVSHRKRVLIGILREELRQLRTLRRLRHVDQKVDRNRSIKKSSSTKKCNDAAPCVSALRRRCITSRNRKPARNQYRSSRQRRQHVILLPSRERKEQQHKDDTDGE